MNILTSRTSVRYPVARPRGQLLKGFRPLALRALDIIISVIAICFLAPAFAVLATMPSQKDSLGLSQLPQLFQVLAGELSLFDGDVRR